MPRRRYECFATLHFSNPNFSYPFVNIRRYNNAVQYMSYKKKHKLFPEKFDSFPIQKFNESKMYLFWRIKPLNVCLFYIEITNNHNVQFNKLKLLLNILYVSIYQNAFFVPLNIAKNQWGWYYSYAVLYICFCVQQHRKVSNHR